jgi:hypothetical protein
MKRRIFFAILLIAAAWVAGRVVTSRNAASGAGEGRDEFNQTYTLQAGATVEVRGINGPVTVETSETSAAEVRVVRTSRSASDLEYGKVTVEATGSGLVVRGGGNVRGFWRRLWGIGPVRQEVTLRLPRRVDFQASGVNGRVGVGEVEGSVEMSGINGRVESAGAGSHAEFNGINGGVTLAASRLPRSGVEMSGINGGVEFRLGQGVGADVEITGLNGGVTMDLPNVTSEERSRHHRSRYNARIGSGGTSVEMHGINGSVRFVPAAPAN